MPAAEPASAGIIRTVAEFWQLPGEARAKPVPFEFECDVLQYDPVWGTLWVQDDTVPTFALTGAKRLPITHHRRYRVRGISMPPNYELSFENATLEELGAARTQPIPVGTRLLQAQLFTNRFVQVDALVDQESRADPTHFNVLLATPERAIQAWVLVRPDEPNPDLVGKVVRLSGIYNAKLTPGGALSTLELMVADLSQVQVLNRLEEDPRFAVAVLPIDRLPQQPVSRRVRVAGEVQLQEPGHFVRLRDATGQVDVLSTQSLPLAPHAMVEAVGYPLVRGTEWTLEEALFRPLQADASAPAVAPEVAAPTEPPITSLQQFWELADEAKLQPRDYDLECTVLYYDPIWKQLWVEDATGSAYVLQGERTLPLRSGQRFLARGRFEAPIRDLTFADASFLPLPPGKPPQILPLGDWRHYNGKLSNRLVTVEALVDRQSLNEGHLRLYLSAEGRAMYAWVLLPVGARPPELEGTVVQVTGIYNPKLSADGVMNSLELMVPGLEQVITRSTLATDPRFNRPEVAIGDLAHRIGEERVRITGEVQAQQPGRTVTVRDATGQVEALVAQIQPLTLHSMVEVVGRPEKIGAEVRLVDATFRPTKAATDLPAKPSTLRLAAQVLELTPEDANKRQRVFLSGVITWSQPDAPYFYLQDVSGGVRVWRGSDPNLVRTTGRNIELHGTTRMGPFAPEVQATEVIKIGDLAGPESRHVLLEHAMTGVEESQWVEMRGFLRAIERRTDEYGRQEQVMLLATAAGDFEAIVPDQESIAHYVGSVLRVHGVCTARLADDGRLAGVRLRVPPDAAKWIQVEEPAPADLFGIPRRSMPSLGRFATTQAFNRRVKIEGTVLHAATDRIVLGEGGDAVVALTREPHSWRPGDRLEAVGFLGRNGARVVLRESVFQKLGAGQMPEPLQMDGQSDVAAYADGRMVRLTGRLLDTTVENGSLRLTVQGDRAVFTAALPPGETHGDAPFTEKGARLALTGVYDVRYDEYGAARGFGLLLRGADDVRVLSRPSWFTPGRILAFTGTLGLATAVIIGWVVALRRRVRRQTAQIRLQLDRERHLQDELERALRLESLGVLAGGIAHDFNNLLTVVMGNISLARLDEGIEEETGQSLAEAERAVARARDLTQQLLTFSKGGAPIRTAVVLSEVVTEVTQFVLRGSKVSAEFTIAPELWPADVDKGQVGQVVQNIVINAAQSMTEGGRLELKLSNATITEGGSMVLSPGKYLKLAITDHGRGIKAEDLPRIFDPYFTTKKAGSGLGLATVYSIVKRHGGHIGVESKLGVGTTFTIWLPAADAVPPPAAETSTGTFTSSAVEGRAGRVLVMDDEEAIRRLSTTMLRRAGYEVTAVKDGAEAVLEYGAALTGNRRYDVVIFDLTVPGGMGGRQAIEELRKIDPTVKAIVSSGYSNDPTLSDHRSSGFDAMVSKPYEISTFLETVAALVKGDAGAGNGGAKSPPS